MNLYQIDENIKQIMELGESEELSQEELFEALGTLETMTKDKIDNIASYIKNLNAEAKALKEEEKNLSERRKAKEKKVDSLTKYIKEYLTLKGIKEMETTRNVVSIAKTPGKTTISDFESFIDWAKTNSKELLNVEYKPNLTKIKEGLKNKDIIPFVKIESGTRLSIK